MEILTITLPFWGGQHSRNRSDNLSDGRDLKVVILLQLLLSTLICEVSYSTLFDELL